MAQNPLVSTLSKTKLSRGWEVLVEDNIGEGVHIHFRNLSGFDFRLELSLDEFRSFCQAFELLVQDEEHGNR